jgi:hypothetical protein
MTRGPAQAGLDPANLIGRLALPTPSAVSYYDPCDAATMYQANS